MTNYSFYTVFTIGLPGKCEATESRESFYEGLITKNIIAEDMYFVEKRDIRVSLCKIKDLLN